MDKPVILTGLRANNDLHIGNYLGALLPIVDLAKKHAGEYQVNLFVPDLHSFTTPIDHGTLRDGIAQNLRVFAAAGLPLENPEIYLYRQSHIPAHSEFCVLLNNFTYFGELSRMTQLKDKIAAIKKDAREIAEVVNKGYGKMSTTDEFLESVSGENITAGLFDYPVLMAADILLYGATYVPVGDDQTQHIELTRDLAIRVNLKFDTELLVPPKPVKQQHEFFGKDQGLRIKDLADPTKKMSKSDESGKGVIFITDTPEDARQKIMAATTDSLGKVAYDKDRQPGVTNLLDILKLLGGRPEDFVGQEQYGPLKEAVAEVLATFLTDFQAKLAKVDDQAIQTKLVSSEKQMNEQANATLLRVQKAVGLRP